MDRWSSWRTAADPALCTACIWGYRTVELRDGAFLITTDPAMTTLTPGALLEVLAEPLTADSAVVLPLHRNRKHVRPDRGGVGCASTTPSSSGPPVTPAGCG